MKPKTDFVPGEKPFTKSEQTYPDYVPDYDSVKDEHIDEGNQEKIVNELSEKLDTNSTKFENMETFVANGKIDIKSEYVVDTISDLTWDRIKVEEKLDQGIEADSTADTVDQIKMEFQESVKIEENMDALMLNEEIDIKTESEESDDLAYDNAQIKKNWEREQMEEEKNLFSRYVCNCTDRSDTGLSVHIECEKHKASKIHECTFCDFKTIHENNLSDHMFKHTNASNLHICEHCNTSFKRKQSLFDHILKKHPDLSRTASNKMYECIRCKFKTSGSASFKTHIAKHKTQKPFQCINCNASYKAKQTLDHHIVQKHPELTDSVSCKIYECIHCEYKTTYPTESAEHDMKHSGIKLPCTKCNELFTSKRSLDHHTSRNHPVSDKIHECTHCEYKTTHARNLTTHTTRHHGAKLTCTKCDVSFALKLSLDNHILQMHPESAASVSHKIYECTHCEYKTTHPGSLPRHLMKHTGAKIKCANCDASFAHKSSLEDHILQKHPEFATALSHKLRKCTQCEYGTVHRKTFNRHMMKHTGNKFPCPNCEASFSSKISLDNHILKKHPEFTAALSCKIYKCTQCQYKTTYRANLHRHVIKHTGNKCTKCDESFTTRQSLNNHILQKHPEFTALVPQKIHKCTYCQYKTTYAKHLVEHMMSHTAKLMCAKCDASFKTKIWLDNHILQKHPECAASVSFKIHKCTRCEYKTTQTRALANHMTKHTGIKLPLTKKRPAFTASVPRKVHKCTLCQYRSTYKNLLTIHMMKHTGARLTCTKCDATFTNKQLLDNHILQKHPECHASVSHKIHKCTSCQYKTTYTRYLDRHMMKHSAKLACTKCDATFTSKQWFENHMLQKHPEVTIAVSHKIHKCTDCEYKSLQKHQLTMHMMKHTGAKLTCPKCDASYLTKHTLDNHIVQNHPEVITYVSRKIHECTYCEYKSVQKLQLTVHMMKHTGDKFTCTKCDASFTFKRSLDNHIIQKHPESAGSLSRKIHKCTHCDYKTIHAQRMTKHKAKHMTKRKAKHNNTKRDGFT